MFRQFSLPSICVGAALLAAVVAASPADATATFSDRDAWAAAVGGFHDVDISGPIGTCGQDGQSDCFFTSVTTPNGVVLTDGNPAVTPGGGTALFHRQAVPDQGWATWSNGNTPFVFANYSDNELIINLSANLPAFGFELEPGAFDLFDMTVHLSDGTDITQLAVDGSGGAKFFGWSGADNLTQITIQCGDGQHDCQGFAIGRLVEAVPEPASTAIFGAGIIGLAAWRRRRARIS